MSANTETDETNWYNSQTTNDWISTQHDQLYFKNESSQQRDTDSRVLLEAGIDLANSVSENWTVVITAGIHRARQVSYRVVSEEQLINLDFNYNRPGIQYIPNVIKDVQQVIDNLSETGTKMED